MRAGYDDQNVFARILRGELPSHKVYEDAAKNGWSPEETEASYLGKENGGEDGSGGAMDQFIFSNLQVALGKPGALDGPESTAAAATSKLTRVIRIRCLSSIVCWTLSRLRRAAIGSRVPHTRAVGLTLAVRAVPWAALCVPFGEHFANKCMNVQRSTISAR